MVNIKNLNKFLSTFNFILCFIGFQLVTSVFLPFSANISSEELSLPIPYREFAFLISIIVIAINTNRKGDKEKVDISISMFFLFWFAFIIRLFYDTNIRFDLNLKDTFRVWLYIFMILPTVYSVYKSYRLIDLKVAYKWILIGTVLTMLLSLLNNNLSFVGDANTRTGGNLALNTIYFGHVGTTGILLSLFGLFSRKKTFMVSLSFTAVLLLSFYIMLIAGSRSPVIALLIVLLFWLFAGGKNSMRGFFISLALLILVIIFIDPILSFMGNISPIIEMRLRLAIYEGSSSGRDLLYKEAFDIFLDNPLFGGQFALFNDFGGHIYSHNIILDSLMALGLFGGIVISFIIFKSSKSSFLIIKNKDSNYWISLLVIQQIVLSLLSNAFYYNQLLNVLFIFIILYYNSKKRQIDYNH